MVLAVLVISGLVVWRVRHKRRQQADGQESVTTSPHAWEEEASDPAE